MIVKVCGITKESNYESIRDLSVDWIGVNFYAPSKRYVSGTMYPTKSSEKRVGVYVQAPLEVVKSTESEYNLDYAQLHGDESVEFCKEVSEFIPVIKVFRIDHNFRWERVESFNFCAYFLFDTKTMEWGGSGEKFDWSILNEYKGDVPFLLSGGIGPDDVEKIASINHPKFAGIDINSRFETEPGVKDVEVVHEFLEQLEKSVKAV